MKIAVALAFQEDAALRLLNWLAAENARIIRTYDERAKKKGEDPLPGLYESGVRYEVEEEELWSDYLNLLAQGFEDCDALAAARAGELRARGWKALVGRDQEDPVRFPGDEGLKLAQALRPASIPAEVILTTRARPGRPGLYHCIVRYTIGGKTFFDDPSARLGMLGDPDSAEVQQSLTAKDLSGRSGARVIRPKVLEPEAQSPTRVAGWGPRRWPVDPWGNPMPPRPRRLLALPPPFAQGLPPGWRLG